MKKLLLIISILFLTGQSLLAQTPHFRNYTVDDGLPSSHVYRAFQDSKGFIWFCTDKGLARFDGYKFEKFTTKNGLPNNDIWQCAEDSEHRIWFLSYANAFLYFDLKDNKFHVIDNPYKEYHDTHVWAYVQEKSGLMRVFMGGSFNLLDIDVKKQKVANHIIVDKMVQHTYCYPLKDSVDVNERRYFQRNNMTSAGAGIWVRAFSEGLQHNIKHHEHISPPINQIPLDFWNSAISIVFDDDKTMYANNDSICFYKNKQFHSRALKRLSNFKGDELSLILNTGNLNRKLVLTNKDVFIIDENINRLKEFDFIKNFNINTTYFDNENNIWICTKDKGIFLLSKKSISSEISAKLSNTSISTITEDPLGRIWVGTTTGKIYFINKAGDIIEQKISFSPNIAIKKIVFSSKGMFVAWNGPAMAIINLKELALNHTIQLTEVSLNFSEKRGYLTYKNSNYIFKNLALKSVDTLDNNHFFLGASNAINILKYQNNVTSFGQNVFLIKSNALLTISNKSVMVGANKGLFKYDTTGKLDSYFPLKQKYPILTKPISSFAIDLKKGIWVGTDGYGVYRFYNNQIQQIPELAGIIVNHLYAENQNNRIWIATNEGVFLLKITDPNATNILKYDIQKISLAQGLPTLEVNTLTVRNNKLYAGTSKGLAMLPIDNIIEANQVKSTVPLIIRNIKINRQDTTVSQRYDLSYTQNNLDIEFVALSFKSDRNIKYDYKMISSNSATDTSWHSVQDLHKEFSLLAPGQYVFSLRAFDINGYPTQTVKPITFIINPPFWDMLWFKLLVISLILGAIILYFYLRTRNIKKEEEQKTEINKKFAELELQALQAQMNPHFVFNALSAIQNFILNNNAEQATDYLSRFSRLMRLFLESSRNKYISLSDEKMLLEHYIELEQLRFKDKFNYKIHVDETVSLDAEVPSMLLQPFVENAINHGLVYKKENGGLLDIIFKKENNKLFCIVEDNGIGRKKAAEIKSKSLKPYKSRGTEITEERLRSLELVENTKIEVSILDKIDESLNPIGTKVTIIIYL
jgi:ligand-binding sensor domain-containing protein/two-component sensor histidine kinase